MIIVPTISNVLAVPNVVDGDTAWVVRHRIIGEHDGQFIVAQDKAGGSKVRLHDGGVGLNAPEKNKDRAGWTMARNDLYDWIEDALAKGKQLELHDYGNGKRDSFGRLLADLFADGESAVKYMRDTRGWHSYK